MPNQFDYFQIPVAMMWDLRCYIDDGLPPGVFLTAVLENNLYEACSYADATNLWILPIYAMWLYNEAPSLCWGSPTRVKAWLTRFDKPNEERAAT